MKVTHYLISSDSKIGKLVNAEGRPIGNPHRVRSMEKNSMRASLNHAWYSIFENEIALKRFQKLILKSEPCFVTNYGKIKAKNSEFYEMNHYYSSDPEHLFTKQRMGDWADLGEIQNESSEERKERIEILNDPFFSDIKTEYDMGVLYNEIELYDEKSSKTLASVKLKNHGIGTGTLINLFKIFNMFYGSEVGCKIGTDEPVPIDETIEAVIEIMGLCRGDAYNLRKLGSLLKLSKEFSGRRQSVNGNGEQGTQSFE